MQIDVLIDDLMQYGQQELQAKNLLADLRNFNFIAFLFVYHDLTFILSTLFSFNKGMSIPPEYVSSSKEWL